MGSDGRLAKVTYLPGVLPPTPMVDTPDVAATTDDTTPDDTTPDDTTMDAAVIDDAGMAARSAVAEDGQAVDVRLEVSRLRAEIAEVVTTSAAGDRPGPGERDAEEKSAAKAVRRAENVSMHALTRRGMSRWELERTLVARELDDETIADELERLERVGLVDDAALAETIVRTQHERKGLGRAALADELRRKHIDQDVIDGALARLDGDDEQARATELAVKRAEQLRSYNAETARRRLTGFLMRKG